MRVRDLVGLSEHTQRRLAWLMELSILGVLALGVLTRSAGIVANALIALGVTQLPPLIQRDLDISLDVGLTLWITAAVWLHIVGTLSFPGSPGNVYATVWWYDHVTHALSASVVAAAGYITVRSIDEYVEDVHFPSRFTFVFVLIFVLAFGVFWEVIEFAVTEFAAFTGTPGVLTQYGLEDTMLDLVFDSIGAVIVATWGTVYLSGTAADVAAWLGRRRAG